MLDCDQALELISAKVDDALTAAESAALEEHLAACGACRALLADFEAMHQALPKLAAAPPAELKDKVMASIHQGKVTSFPARRTQWRWRSLASLAAVLVLVVVGSYTVRTGLLGGNSGNADLEAQAPAAAAAGGEVRQLPESQSVQDTARIQEAPAAGEPSIYAAAVPLTADQATALLCDYLGWPSSKEKETTRMEADGTQPQPVSGPAEADGSTPTLTFAGLSQDGTAYEFTLTRNGEETLYRVLLSTGAVETVS